MNKLTSQQIRTTWLNFFKSKGHMIEPGASLIPHNDPTLLWINAGVAALKKYFDGSEIPESKRITNVQKCIRTNDIENVGNNSEHGGSRKKEISKALESAANDITGIAGIGEEWMGQYYQLANRLYIQWVLNKSGISAIQLSLFFCGDVNNEYICPKTRAEWQDELLKEKKELRLTTPKASEFLARHYRELYIDVRSNRDII